MVPGQVQAFEVAADVALIASLASPVLACRQCFLRKLQPRVLGLGLSVIDGLL